MWWYHVEFESCLCEQSEQQLSTVDHYTHQLQPQDSRHNRKWDKLNKGAGHMRSVDSGS